MPTTYPTYHAARRLWCIRELLRERAMDAHAAELSLSLLEQHPNPRVRSLATATLADRLIARQEAL